LEGAVCYQTARIELISTLTENGEKILVNMALDSQKLVA